MRPKKRLKEAENAFKTLADIYNALKKDNKELLDSYLELDKKYKKILIENNKLKELYKNK